MAYILGWYHIFASADYLGVCAAGITLLLGQMRLPTSMAPAGRQVQIMRSSLHAWPSTCMHVTDQASKHEIAIGFKEAQPSITHSVHTHGGLAAAEVPWRIPSHKGLLRWFRCQVGGALVLCAEGHL